jgi:glycosyltransferase A (GT-A) superfamily protein (DUF2064 family)
MARAPRLGRGKKRLARDIGSLAAWRFYRTETARLLRRLSGDPRWHLWLAVTPDAALHDPGLWPFEGRILAQGPGDLGQRMGRIFQGLPPGPLVIIGSDIPEVTPGLIVEAFGAIGRRDWVLGPAGDGGYWLIGARRRPRLALPFEGVRWSSKETLADTLKGLGRQSVALISTLADIDSGADLAAWRRRQKERALS